MHLTPEKVASVPELFAKHGVTPKRGRFFDDINHTCAMCAAGILALDASGLAYPEFVAAVQALGGEMFSDVAELGGIPVDEIRAVSRGWDSGAAATPFSEPAMQELCRAAAAARAAIGPVPNAWDSLAL